MDTVELAKRLVVGFLVDQVRSRSLFLMFVGTFVLIASVVLVATLEGAPRVLAVLSGLVGAVWLLQTMAVRLLERFAEPLAANSHETAVGRALT